MEFDQGWILLGLPMAFALGWLASRFDLRQLKLDNQRTPKAYFKGLNHLLNEQQDQAIDAFIEAVQNDPDTSELHFALGNLFRRRGEYERAVRVHQHLLARADLSRSDRDRAQHALALDYLKAGLLDRAEAALRPLEGTAFASMSHLALLGIYERTRDWPQAALMADKLAQAGEGSFKARQAHYLCEQSEAYHSAEEWPTAQALLQQALSLVPHNVRASLALAQGLHRQGQANPALDLLLDLAQAQPQAMPLIATQLAQWAPALGQVARVRDVLQKAYDHTPSLDVLKALAELMAIDATASVPALYLRHLEREPSLVVASQWMQGQFNTPAGLQKALDRAVKPLLRYRCAACGFEASQHFWQCPGCQAWDSYPPKRVEEL
ncbi:MAG: lipopolysaccharide assembly protein LapB [Betaproteobacteria bacterium]|nr:lipopolysaccharide assembly protein LapB [Betaproteobacteria bacterium]NBY04035.1 lipopolysaccharide assembly protein LapB [Betaproteobacteria bacterium]